MLWLWILGLSENIIHNKFGDIEYQLEYEKCKDEVHKLHPIQQSLNNHDEMIDKEQHKQDMKDGKL